MQVVAFITDQRRTRIQMRRGVGIGNDPAGFFYQILRVAMAGKADTVGWVFLRRRLLMAGSAIKPLGLMPVGQKRISLDAEINFENRQYENYGEENEDDENFMKAHNPRKKGKLNPIWPEV